MNRTRGSEGCVSVGKDGIPIHERLMNRYRFRIRYTKTSHELRWRYSIRSQLDQLVQLDIWHSMYCNMMTP